MRLCNVANYSQIHTSSLFWDVMQRWLVVTDVSGRPLCLIFKGQSSWTASPLNMGLKRCPWASVTTNLRCVTSQKSECGIFTAAEALSHANRCHFSEHSSLQILQRYLLPVCTFGMISFTYRHFLHKSQGLLAKNVGRSPPLLTLHFSGSSGSCTFV